MQLQHVMQLQINLFWIDFKGANGKHFGYPNGLFSQQYSQELKFSVTYCIKLFQTKQSYATVGQMVGTFTHVISQEAGIVID